MTDADASPEYPVGVDEALDLVRANAWQRRVADETTCGHRGCEDHPRTESVIHTTLGAFGADWGLGAALAAVQDARSIWWAFHLTGHDLVVEQADGKTLCFQIRAPDAVRGSLVERLRAQLADGPAR